MKNIFFRLVSVSIVTLLAGVATANAAQVVLLDFDSGTDGAIVYSGVMRDQIVSLMNGHYADFDVSVTKTDRKSVV
jgi:hypothetical protein